MLKDMDKSVVKAAERASNAFFVGDKGLRANRLLSVTATESNFSRSGARRSGVHGRRLDR